MPTYIAIRDFWDLSFTELTLVSNNIRQAKWDRDYQELSYNRVLASDISRVLAGKPFLNIQAFLSENPREKRIRSVEEVERTLLYWASLED